MERAEGGEVKDYPEYHQDKKVDAHGGEMEAEERPLGGASAQQHFETSFFLPIILSGPNTIHGGEPSRELERGVKRVCVEQGCGTFSRFFRESMTLKPLAAPSLCLTPGIPPSPQGIF